MTLPRQNWTKEPSTGLLTIISLCLEWKPESVAGATYFRAIGHRSIKHLTMSAPHPQLSATDQVKDIS
jgi:hypothetical protein